MDKSALFGRVVVSLGFGLTGVLKVWDLLAPGKVGHTHAFTTHLQAVTHAPLVSGSAALIELACAVLILSPWWRQTSKASFALAAAFSLLLSYIQVAGLPTGSCGCFGSWEPPVAAHFGYVFALLIASYVVLLEGCAEGATQ